MTDKLLDIVTPLNEAILALAEKNAALEQRVERVEQLEEASIEFYCGVIDKAEWRIAIRNSPKGQELIAFAEDDLDKLTTQQKPTEEAMEEA